MIRVYPWFKLAVCALPFAFLWWQLIRQLSIQWNLNPQYAYGWAVPFLCAYLIWNRIQGSKAHPATTHGSTVQRFNNLTNTGFNFQLSAFQLFRRRSALPVPRSPRPVSSSQPSIGSPPSVRHTPASNPCAAVSPPATPPFTSIGHRSSGICYLLLCLFAFLYAPTRLVQEANPGWSLVSWPLALAVIGVTLLFVYLGLPASSCSIISASTVKLTNDARFAHPAFGFRISDFGFPLGFFLVAVPWPWAIENSLIQGLTRLNTALTIEVIGWLNIPAIQHGNVIELATGSVGIDEACSGIRSLQATLMLSLFFGELYRLSVTRRVMCVFTGFAIAMLCNLGRMLLLTWVAARKGEQAIAGWHDPAGVTILLACFIGVWLFAARQASRGTSESTIPSPRRGEGQGEVSASGDSSLPCSSVTAVASESSIPSPLGGEGEGEVSAAGNSSLPCFSLPTPPCPLRSLPVSAFSFQYFCSSLAFLRPSHFSLRTYCVVLAAWLLLVELGVAAWYRHVESGIRDFTTWNIAWPEEHADFRDLPIPARATEMLRYDQARQAQWIEPDGTRWQLSWFYWKPGQTAGYLAKSHNPLVCMPAAGYGVVSTSPAQEVEIHGLRFPYRIYSFEQGGATVHVLYCRWDDCAVEQSFATEGVSRFNRLRTVWTGRGNHGQRVITMALWSARNADEAHALLLQQLQRLLVVESPSGPL